MKKFTIADRILRRPVTVIMTTLLIIGFGLFSLSRLKVTLFPSVNIPVLAIQTNYRDVAPKDITQLLVKPLEGAVSSIEGVDELDSHVRKGGAFIIMRLESGVNTRRTELKVREAIDRIRDELPSEASEPVIFQFDPDNRPIMQLSVEASNRGLDKLRQLSTELIEQRLERLPAVASADTRGGLERQIFVDVDPMSLAQYKLVPSDIETALRNNNQQMPIGDIIANKNSYSVLAKSTFTNVDQIRQTIIKMTDNGVPVRIEDVADVKDSFAEISTLVEVNGKNSVSIEIQKQSDANTLDAVNSVLGAIPKIEQTLPPGVSIQVLTSEGQNIDDSINNLSQSALIALVVVVIILLLFMGGWRISLIVSMAIPVSLTASFAAMDFANITMNIFSITALALAVGLLVDNAIVVSESIAGKLEQGLSKFNAALEGTNEVIGALLGSTLTTLAVFVPIIGISGVVGQVFRDFALTISIAIGFSFLASIILLPVLSVILLDKSEFQRHSFTFKAIHKLEKVYTRWLRVVLNRKVYVVLFVLLTMGGTYYLFKNLPTEFFPSTDNGQFDVRVELPSGTKLVKTANIMRHFSNQIQKLPEVKTVVDKIGQQGYRTETNRGEITVKLVSANDREKSTDQVSLQVRRMLKAPGVEVSIRGAGGGGGFGGFGNNNITLTLVGPDVEVLQAISNRIEQVVKADSNVISVDNGRSDPMPELHYFINRQRVNRAGSNLNQVAQSLKTQTQGTRVGYYREEGHEIPIMVRATKNALRSRFDLMNLQLIQVGDQRIPVSALGHFESREGLSGYSRRDRETILDVTIKVAGNANQYRQKLINFVRSNVVLPEGYRYEFSGSTRNFRESSNDIQYALLFALALTYMIMASLFENFKDPLVIWFTIPLAFFGALFGLFATGTALSVTAYTGILMLVGVVVNNGIVLVDYIHLYTKEETESDVYFDELIEACRRRLRPILLTALTTICSMIPLALGIGAGAQTWAPLARAVIGGLTFATILTLFVVPTFVIGISKKRREAVRNHFKSH